LVAPQKAHAIFDNNIGFVSEYILTQQAKLGCTITPSLPDSLMCSTVLEHHSDLGEQSEMFPIYVQIHPTIQHMEAIWPKEAFHESTKYLTQVAAYAIDLGGEFCHNSEPSFLVTQRSRVEF
jgi:hypothetical protein